MELIMGVAWSPPHNYNNQMFQKVALTVIIEQTISFMSERVARYFS